MAVATRIVAFSKQSRILLVGKRRDVQSMSRAKARLHSEEHVPVSPRFGEKICALVQAHSMNRNGSRHPLANVSSQAFGRNRTILQSRNFVEMTMIELFSE